MPLKAVKATKPAKAAVTTRSARETEIVALAGTADFGETPVCS